MDPLLQQIMALCFALEDLGWSYTFVSCSDHVSTEANKEGDGAAINAADSLRVDAFGIWLDVTKQAATSTIMYERQQMWNVRLSVLKWQIAGDRSRQEQIWITRLCTGHTNLTFSYILQGQRTSEPFALVAGHLQWNTLSITICLLYTSRCV